MESPIQFPPSSPPQLSSGAASPVPSTRKLASGLLPGFVPSSPVSSREEEDRWGAKLSDSLLKTKREGAVPKYTKGSIENTYDDELLSSSPPGLPSHLLRAKTGKAQLHEPGLLGHDHLYPTPLPTSSLGNRSSSPPLASYNDEEEEHDLRETISRNAHIQPADDIFADDASESIPAKFAITLPRSGKEVTVGRSSQSCDFALSSKNKLVSRVHVSMAYIPETDRVLFTCMGWNGCTVSVPEFTTLKNSDLENHGAEVFKTVCNGQTEYIVPKGHHIEVEYVKGISLDVRGEKASIKVAQEKAHKKLAKAASRAPLKEVLAEDVRTASTDASMNQMSLTLSNADNLPKPEAVKLDAPKDDRPLKSQKIHTVPEKRLSRPSPRVLPEPTQVGPLKEHSSKLREEHPVKKSLTGNTPAPIQKSAFAFKDFGKRQDSQKRNSTAALLSAKGPDAKRPATEASRGDSPKIKLVTVSTPKQSSFKKPSSPAVTPKTPEVREKKKEKVSEVKSAAEKLAAVAKPEVAAPKTEQATASVPTPAAKQQPSEHDTDDHTEASPASEDASSAAPVSAPSRELPSSEEMDEEVSRLDLEQLTKLICNHLAFSRLSSTPLSTLRGSSPVLNGISKRLLRHLLRDGKAIPCVGIIYRQGKDAAGKPLEEEYYYVAEKDTDLDRKAMVEQLRGRGGGLRACRKTHKQYFWKKPAK